MKLRDQDYYNIPEYCTMSLKLFRRLTQNTTKKHILEFLKETEDLPEKVRIEITQETMRVLMEVNF